MASKISRWSGVSWVVVSDLDQITGMLPLTGGTLTGPLNMTTATMTGNLTGAGGSLNFGIPSRYASTYRGVNFGAEYLIMTDNTNTFVSAPTTGGTVYLRAGQNGSYNLNLNSNGTHTMVGNLSLGGYSFDCETVQAGWSGIYFGGARLSGWYIDGSSAWIRSRSNYGIWLASGLLGSDGGLSLGMGGGMTAGYIADMNGYVRITQRLDVGAIGTSGEVSTGHITSNGIDVRGSYRVTGNGGNGGDWTSHAYLAQNGNASRSGYSIHPTGVAKSIDMMANNGYVNFLNEAGDWYADLYAASITQVSQKRGKQDIVSWPPKSAGSAVMDACNRLSLIDVISYRIKPELALIHAESMLEGQGPQRTHDCTIDSCLGTDMETDPCQRVKDWSNPTLGIIIEDLATVLPEAVGLDPDGNPGGMRLGSMIGYLLAVCKEQQERIESLEQHLQEAA